MGQGPVHRVQDLRRTDPPIAVGIYIGQHALVQFEIAGGTGQRGPQLLVQTTQCSQVFRSFQLHLVETAGTEEFPTMSEIGRASGRERRENSEGAVRW